MPRLIRIDPSSEPAALSRVICCCVRAELRRWLALLSRVRKERKQVSYSFSRAAETTVAARPEAVFAVLDNPLRLGRHMTKPSAMTLGGSMRYRLDAAEGRAVGSIIRVDGSVLGLTLSVVERVIERHPPCGKIWETIEEPKLLVFGNYRLGFEVVPDGPGSRVRLFIAYNLPRTTTGRLLGPLGAPVYARWCLSRMIAVAREARAGEVV